MNTIKAYVLSVSMITFINPLLLAANNPGSLTDLATNTFEAVANCSLGECLSQVAPDQVPGDVIEFLRQVLIQRYRVLLLNITKHCSPTVLIGHSVEVTSVAFSPDGKFALTGSGDHTALLWDIQDKNNIQSYVLNGHTHVVESVAFSPDGKYALTGSIDHTARLWDIEDINNIQSYVLNDHTHYVSSVAFSPNGKFALTAGTWDDTHLWDIQDINNIQPYVLSSYTKAIPSAAFSPDGKYVLTGSQDKIARLWNLVDPLISMESLTLPMILLIIKLDQNAQNNNQILTQNHYSETFNACDDVLLKQRIVIYFKLEPTTASSSNSN
jgi:WD40 repeat protein